MSRKVIGNISVRRAEDWPDEDEEKEGRDGTTAKVEKSWFSRAAEKISSAASRVTKKTASLLDFHTGAADVIFARHILQNGGVRLESTSWHVHVARDTKSTLTLEEEVEIFINGVNTGLKMKICESHNCEFLHGACRPTAEQLDSLIQMPMNLGKNELRFRLSSAPNTPFFASLYVWDAATAAIVVCDIDGTVTRNELIGHGMLAPRLGWEQAHAGVCDAFAAIDAAGYSILYLTGRPITRADKTRDLLRRIGGGGGGANDSSSSSAQPAMPEGPLITTTERSLPALMRVLRQRGGGSSGASGGSASGIHAAAQPPQQRDGINNLPQAAAAAAAAAAGSDVSVAGGIADGFKVAVLREVHEVFQSAPGGGGRCVLYGAFGNRPSDAQAYRAVSPIRVKKLGSEN